MGPAVAGEHRDPLPTSIAALGDSITRGFNACGFYRDCTRRSWSTGDDGAVHSQRLRLEQRGARLQQWNLARSGARSDALAEQAARAGEVGADYVTIEIGANDVCARSEADMTSLQDFRRNIRAGLSTLRQRVPGAQVYIASIPDLRQLWAIGHTSWYVRRTWAELGVCPSMLARSNSQDPADVGRRDRVRSRTIRFNRILAQECAAYGPMCWFDQLAVFEATFTRDQISRWDYFHPSVEGQQLLAAITWESGFFGADED
ncbi:MAG TPA: GDSL-type esterase/lipase family protein [Gemmatimonadales bacterium]|nr:GDSL-type esterase/lipase family protein [Gemmatimonadales bacterium]